MAVEATNLVLTKRGWVGYTDIVREDETLGRTKHGTLEWTPILDVEASRGSVRSLQFISRRITSTLDHPWVARVPSGTIHVATDKHVMLADLASRTKLLIGGWYDNEGTIRPEVARLYALMVAGRAEVQRYGRENTIAIPQTDNNTYLKRVLFNIEHRRYGAYGSYNYTISGPTAKATIKLLNKSVSENVWNMGPYERQEFIDTMIPIPRESDIGVDLAIYLNDLILQGDRWGMGSMALTTFTVVDGEEPVDLFQLTTELGSWTMQHEGKILLTGG